MPWFDCVTNDPVITLLQFFLPKEQQGKSCSFVQNWTSHTTRSKQASRTNQIFHIVFQTVFLVMIQHFSSRNGQIQAGVYILIQSTCVILQFLFFVDTQGISSASRGQHFSIGSRSLPLNGVFEITPTIRTFRFLKRSSYQFQFGIATSQGLCGSLVPKRGHGIMTVQIMIVVLPGTRWIKVNK
jgi:hypothetical protein